MISIHMIGNLVRDPSRRDLGDGSQVVNFTVAVNHGRDRDQAMFVDVSAWGSLGEACAKCLSKGKKVFVAGMPVVRGWTGRDGDAKAGLTVNAREVEFLTPRDAGEGGVNSPSTEEEERP